jgi:raffinose/stachyose/melibiose transport system substrate-binding protein
MKKKLLSFLLCVMLFAVTLNGCNSDSEITDNNTDGGSNDEEQTLVLWSIATESDSFNNAYNKAIEDFENNNKKVTIKHETFENESYKTKLKTAVSGNDLPDLFYTWGGGFSKPFVESGKVLDIDKYCTDEYKSMLLKTALENTTYNGKIYGSTYTNPISVLFYNKKIFKENELEPPTTFKELETVCESLKEKDITPIAISAKDRWVLAMTNDLLTMRYAGPEKVKSALLRDGQKYDDPDFLSSAKSFKKLTDMGAFLKGATGMSNDEAKTMFLEGKAAMHTMGTWLASDIQNKVENSKDFDVMPFPVTSDNAESTDFMGGAVDAIMVSKSTKHPDIAGKAVFELARSISKYSYLDGAGLPVWKKDYDDSNVSEMTKKLAGFVEGATSFTMWFDTFMESKESGEYLALLQEMYVGNLSPEDFVKRMDELLNP